MITADVFINMGIFNKFERLVYRRIHLTDTPYTLSFIGILFFRPRLTIINFDVVIVKSLCAGMQIRFVGM